MSGAMPAAPPDFTAIVVAYESEALMARCLGALAGAAQERTVEAIVVDNGSRDATVARAAAALDTPAWRGRGAIVPLGRNRGFAAAANAGAARARGRLLVFVNTDAFAAPGALDQVAAAIEAPAPPSSGRVALASPQLYHPDGRRQRTAPEWPPRRAPPQEPVDVAHLRGAFLAVAADAFAALGGFDERFFFYLEETDLCLRAHGQGWRVLLVPGARVVHLGGATANRWRGRARVEHAAGRALLARKHGLVAPGALGALADVGRTLGQALGAGAAAVLTLGLVPSLRARAAAALWVAAWRLRGRPDGWGLRPAD
ncbi:MAG TPA: glycosyltransferase [Myxococcota bacterium]|nr:glycosyltransferase [Myxococcota bacterium]